MTIPSFEPVQYQKLPAPKSPLLLKNGQIFYGKVNQIFPNQTAEIQIGGHRLLAKLEMPLKAGDSHFFQVTSINPQMELKIVSGPIRKESANIQQLMESLKLPKSREMQQVLSYFIKNQLPISKEQLLLSENWLKNLPDGFSGKEALQVLGKLSDLKIPFTEETFKALLFGSKTTGIAHALEQFAQLVQNNGQVSPQVKSNLLNVLQSIAQPFEAETAGLLVARSVHTLLERPEQGAKQQEALNLLKEANILPKEATLRNWLNHLRLSSGNGTAGSFLQLIKQDQAAGENVRQFFQWIENEPSLSEQQKSEILQFMKSYDDTTKIEGLVQRLHVFLLKAYSEQTINRPFVHENAISPKEHLLSLLKSEPSYQPETELRNIAKILVSSKNQAINMMMAESEAMLLDKLNGQGFQKAIWHVLKSLGLSYEAALNRNTAAPDLIQPLKPLLVALVQDNSAPMELKTGAEALLARLNGMQLLSGEMDHQHQIIMQIPMQFLGKQVEATVQWNGRMKKDGKIDSDYARILFYLNMEALNETVIDMQVQNRIVTIYVYNDKDGLEVLSEPLKKSLKAALEEKNYHLSGLMFKPFEKNESGPFIKEKSHDHKTLKRGVDIRI